MPLMRIVHKIIFEQSAKISTYISHFLILRDSVFLEDK